MTRLLYAGDDAVVPVHLPGTTKMKCDHPAFWRKKEKKIMISVGDCASVAISGSCYRGSGAFWSELERLKGRCKMISAERLRHLSISLSTEQTTYPPTTSDLPNRWRYQLYISTYSICIKFWLRPVTDDSRKKKWFCNILLNTQVAELNYTGFPPPCLAGCTVLLSVRMGSRESWQYFKVY